MRQFLPFLFLCAAGMGCAVPFSQAQELTPVIPPPTTSSDTSPKKISNKPVGFTALGTAQELFRAGEFNEAIERYNEIIKSGNDVAIAYAGLASVYLKLKKPDDAYSAAEKGVEIDPSLPAVHSALGEVFFRQGKLYEAQTEFRFPIETHHEDARAYLGLSRLYDVSFNFKKAKVAIDKAHALDPADPDIRSAWMGTRPVAERLKSMEAAVASPSKYYSRVQNARFKQQLALMEDHMQHPERTCSLANPPDNAELPLQPIIKEDQQTRVGLDVQINGLKSRLLFVGAGLVVNETIAQKAGIQPIARVDIDDLGD